MQWLVPILLILAIGMRREALWAQLGNEAFERRLLDNPRELILELHGKLAKLDPQREPAAWLQVAQQLLYVGGGNDDPDAKATRSILPEFLRLSQAQGDPALLWEAKRLQLELTEKMPAKQRIAAYDELLQSMPAHGYELTRAQILFNRSLVLENEEAQTGLALRGHQQALSYLESSPSLYLNLNIKNRMAIIFANDGQTEEAQRLKRQLHESCKKAEFRYFCTNHYYELANDIINPQQLERFAEADGYLIEAERLAERLQEKGLLAMLAYARLKYYKALGQNSEALEAGFKSLRISEELKQEDFIVFTLYYLAEIEQKAGHYQEALVYTEKAITILGDRDFQGSIQMLHQQAADLNKSLHRPEQALRHFEIYADAMRKEAEQKEKFAYAQSAAAIGLRTEEEKSRSLQQELKTERQMQVLFLAICVLGIVALVLGFRSHRQSLVVFAMQKQIRAMLDQINLGIVTLDHTLSITPIHSRFLYRLFEARSQLTGLDFIQLLEQVSPEPLDLSSLRERLSAAFGCTMAEWKEKVGTLLVETHVRHSDEDRRLELSWQGIVDNHSRICQILVTLSDITEESHLREAIEIQNERLISLGTLSATVAHDIASPSQLILHTRESMNEDLGKLRQLLELVFADSDDEETQAVWQRLEGMLGKFRNYLGDLRKAIDRIIKVQKAIRNYSRQVEKEEVFALHELIDESLTLTHKNVRYARVEIECDAMLDVEGIRSQIGQVLTNLLNNAGDAVEEAGGSAKAKPADIRILVRDLGQAWQLRIEDAGLGIPQNVRAQLFQPFFTTKRADKGTGLGLSICKKIIHQHGGELSIEDDGSLGGACFQMTVPRRMAKVLGAS